MKQCLLKITADCFSYPWNWVIPLFTTSVKTLGTFYSSFQRLVSCLFSGNYFLFPFDFIPLGYFFLISFFCSILFFFCNRYYPLASSNLCCSIYLVELQGKGKTQDILCSREYRNAFSWSLMKYSIGKYGCVNTLWVLWFQCVFLKIGKWDDCNFQRDWWRKNVSVDLVLSAIVRTQDFSAHKA